MNECYHILLSFLLKYFISPVRKIMMNNSSSFKNANKKTFKPKITCKTNLIQARQPFRRPHMKKEHSRNYYPWFEQVRLSQI